MADEYTDITNKEQFSFCIRTVDDNLEIKEDFLDFYSLENIKKLTVVNGKKDTLLWFNLSLQHCRGQRYDGASNVMGKKSGVATILLVGPCRPAKVTLSAWLLKFLQHVVKYHVTL